LNDVDTAIPLGRAHLLASTVIREARHAGIAADALMPVGDLRRYEPAVTSVELLGVAPPQDRDAILTAF